MLHAANKKKISFLKKSKKLKNINIGILTNYSANFLEPYIKNSGFKLSINLKIFFPNFDQIEKSIYEKLINEK